MAAAIEVKDLSFTHRGQCERTIQQLDFQIEHGEIFGFLGPSGAGKSTTQKILIGILKKYEGSARVLGLEVEGSGSDFYERIGVAFEFPNFYGRFTALENLNLFRSLYKGPTEDPRELLKLVGLDTSAKLRVSQYSKGMKMRLNFIRALLNKPDILFLDEPTSGLDPVNAQTMKKLIREQKQLGRTVLITTHQMNTAEEICDRVAFMVDGRIPLIDSPRELKLKYGERMLRVEYESGRERELMYAQFALDGIGSNRAYLELLRNQRIETMHTMEATLEQIFIKVTGKKMDLNGNSMQEGFG